jgi:hypothetical protein
MVALTTAVGATVLAIYKDDIPPFLAGLGTASISTLGMLAAVLYQRGTGGNGRNGSGGGGIIKPP